MILIFDYFETIVQNSSIDFDRGLKVFWEKYYRDRCSFEEISAFGCELFQKLLYIHKSGKEYAFVKDELPEYAAKYGGEAVEMDAEEEAGFLMLCNEMERMPGIDDALSFFEKKHIPMYVLSNSGFTGAALSIALERLKIGRYFKKIWSSADFGYIKPDRGFFEQAISCALKENPEDKREDIVFVGDTYDSDVIGAYNAGLKVIWINPCHTESPDIIPVRCIDSISELVKAVESIE